jgi:acetyl-CoA C-acetyltransferase
MQLAAAACERALQDAGIQAGAVDTIAVIRLFSDSAKAWASPFGGSDNPPESIARRIGAAPARRIYSEFGGTQPLQIMLELFQRVARGEIDVALLTGAEAIATQRHAVRNGWALDWREVCDAPLDNRESGKRFVSKEELRGGLGLPVHYYALIENSQAHRMGHDMQQHRQYMAQLMAPFSAVAAANPFSQFPREYTAQELATIGPGNYPLNLPYSKLLVAQDAVNQSSALVLTSVGHARRLGVPPGQWIFLEAYAEGIDHYLCQREDPGRSQAMSRVLSATMEQAAASHGDLDLVDIYSCFPCAVQAACEVLGLPTDGTRALTVTGGLPYFGGPGNNYTSHALVEMALRLRGNASRALVTANGGMLSKHAAAVLTSSPERAAGIDWGNFTPLNIDLASSPARAMAAQPARGRVISWTVIPRAEKESLGVVLAETTGGERFIAASTQPRVTDWMQHHCPIGRAIDVQAQEEQHVFSFSEP